MSRILRRPLFRGGHVSSYGTGIASGLADGGMPPRRGLVIDPGGYAGKTRSKNLFDVEDVIGETQTGAALGHLKAPDFQPIQTVDEAAVEETGEINGVDTVEKDSKWEIKDFEGEIGVNTWDEYIRVPERTVKGVTTGGGVKLNPNYKRPTKTIERTVKGVPVKTEVPLSDAEIEETLWSPGTGGEEHVPAIRQILEDDEDNKTEEPEISAKEAVEANKKLFAELLGLDKARGQDIGDMLIGASAKLLKPGATVKGGLGEFMEAESQRPSRRQKLQDTAAGLAIQDYIAGKRSKEATELMMTKMDREYEKKFEMAMPSKDDTLQVAKLKLLSLKQDPSSTKGIKYLIGVQDPENVDNVFTAKKGLKLDDVADKKPKILKYLNPGYNILTDPDRGKIIIKYDGSNTVGGVTIVTLTELWAKP